MGRSSVCSSAYYVFFCLFDCMTSCKKKMIETNCRIRRGQQGSAVFLFVLVVTFVICVCLFVCLFACLFVAVICFSKAMS